MNRVALCSIVLVLAVAAAAAAGDDPNAVLGLWLTAPGSDNGQARVEITRAGEGYSGKIVWLEKPTYPDDDDRGMGGQIRVDRENPDPAMRANPIIGLEILGGFHYVGKGQWKKGTIYDPENGKTYSCIMRLGDDGVLKIRGYIGVSLIGRTSEWTRVTPAPPPSQ